MGYVEVVGRLIAGLSVEDLDPQSCGLSSGLVLDHHESHRDGEQRETRNQNRGSCLLADERDEADGTGHDRNKDALPHLVVQRLEVVEAGVVVAQDDGLGRHA